MKMKVETFKKKQLVPNAIYLMATVRTTAICDPNSANLKAPAFDDLLTTPGAEGVFAFIAGHITGV
ncbi:MAG: hypothetical protein PVF98_00730, partial [Desulfobacterales bacterium]